MSADAEMYRTQYERLMVECGLALGWFLDPPADEHKAYLSIAHMDVPERITMRLATLQRAVDASERHADRLADAVEELLRTFAPGDIYERESVRIARAALERDAA